MANHILKIILKKQSERTFEENISLILFWQNASAQEFKYAWMINHLMKSI